MIMPRAQKQLNCCNKVFASNLSDFSAFLCVELDLNQQMCAVQVRMEAKERQIVTTKTAQRLV